MASTDKSKAEETAGAKQAPAKHDEPSHEVQLEVVEVQASGKDVKEKKKKKAANVCKNCLIVLFVLLSLIAVIKSIAEIVVTVSTAIFTKLYGSEESGRLVGMVILAVLAAVTISILVNALVAVFRKQSKHLHAASIVLFVVAAIQAVVLGVAVRVTLQDQVNLSRSLQLSFQLNKENNPRHAAIWATTQYEMSCCGLYSPDDYRSTNLPDYFPPNVPISCCPSYDPTRSELVQEREREVCKIKKTYYREGCEHLVLEGFKGSAHLVLGLTISLIVVEVLLAIITAVLAKQVKKAKSQRKNAEEPEKENNPNP